MKTVLLITVFLLLGKAAEAQNSSIIKTHMTTLSTILSSHISSLNQDELKYINALSWDASDFDETFYVFFNHYDPEYGVQSAKFTEELNNWKIAIKKDLKQVSLTDVREYIKTIKKMKNANLLMYYYINTYANFFFSQRSMQDHYPVEVIEVK